jgi:hypothetical protein
VTDTACFFVALPGPEYAEHIIALYAKGRRLYLGRRTGWMLLSAVSAVSHTGELACSKPVVVQEPNRMIRDRGIAACSIGSSHNLAR